MKMKVTVVLVVMAVPVVFVVMVLLIVGRAELDRRRLDAGEIARQGSSLVRLVGSSRRIRAPAAADARVTSARRAVPFRRNRRAQVRQVRTTAGGAKIVGVARLLRHKRLHEVKDGLADACSAGGRHRLALGSLSLQLGEDPSLGLRLSVLKVHLPHGYPLAQVAHGGIL